MSEKEKMLNGDYYISRDEALTAEREHAKDELYEFNSIRPSEREKREKVIRGLFGKTGENCWIESPFNCDYGYNIFVGANTIIGAGSVVTKDIPENVIAAGVPCKVLREITENDKLFGSVNYFV